MGRPKGSFDKEFRGTIDKKVVVRQNKVLGTILSVYPDMSKIVPSEAQLAQRAKLRRAQNYTKVLLSDPAIKAFYKERCGPRQRPHNILISELMKGITPFPPDQV